MHLSRSLLSVLLVVAVGDFGRRPHMTASAVFLYNWRAELSEFERPFVPKKLTLDKRTCIKIAKLFSDQKDVLQEIY